ncbi:uncharacterized protein LOC135215892 [Macrobrachium nipponense]|uniref:uncharacterized protein LOC135215892 n=1 Tax=Macrobrachium nipponense TaxID=159736 RepID=UPI0030C81E5F
MGVILNNRCHKLYEVKRIVQASAARLRLLWKVACGSVGASVPMVKRLYTSMIRSIIDYSSSMLLPLRKSYIGILEIIQNKAARSIIGAPKSVRQEILRNEAGLHPIHHRIARTAIIQLYRSIMTDDDGLTRDTLIHSYPRRLKNGWVTAARQLIEDSSMKEYLDVTKIDVKDIPPWSVPETEILLSALKGKKEEMNPALLKDDYFQRLDSIQGERVHYYTDGSLLEDGRAGSGVTVYQNGEESELLGITGALSIINRNKDNAIIATDSLSALQSLTPRKAGSNIIVRRAIDLLSQIRRANRMVTFIWVPSHIGIKGNERADELAKEGARKERVDYKLTPSLSMLKDSVGMEIMQRYNEKIEILKETHSSIRKYLEITGGKPPDYKLCGLESRREQTTYSRLRMQSRYLWEVLPAVSPSETCCRLCGELRKHTLSHYLVECEEITHYRPQGLSEVDLLKHFLQPGVLKRVINTHPKFACSR